VNVQGLALAWYKECDWAEWRSLNPEIDLSYTRWLARMKAAYQHYKAGGVPIQKVLIRPREFKQWSEQSGAGFGTHARARFAMAKMMQNEQRQKRTSDDDE
jgi:hypothetical protein